MEMELGVKLTRVADEFTSDLKIGKDRADPIFISTETDALFVLTAHLKGYRRENIKIDINEDGSLIGISGERQVKETVMVGWRVYKKDTDIKGFKKVFRIPNGVVLDNIEAKFNEDESTLTITMPKKVKGIRGAAIEEVKEKQELVKEGSGNLRIMDEKSTEGISNHEKLKAKIGEDDEHGYACTEDARRNDCLKDGEEGEQVSTPIHAHAASEERKNGETIDEIGEKSEIKHDQEHDRVESLSTENRVLDKEERLDEDGNGEEKRRGKRWKMCIPIVAGSTLLVSFVVFVIQIMRSKNQNSRRRG